jgi:hypothetical protein
LNFPFVCFFIPTNILTLPKEKGKPLEIGRSNDCPFSLYSFQIVIVNNMSSIGFGDYLIAIVIFLGLWYALRSVFWWYYGTKKTHKMLEEIIAELKKKNEQ